MRIWAFILTLCFSYTPCVFAQEPAAQPSTETPAATDLPKIDGVFSPGKDGVSDPVLLTWKSPKYPKEARKAHAEGVVLIGLVVATDGKALNPHVIHGAGYGMDESALQCVRKYRFKPSVKDGKAVPVQIAVQVHFHICPDFGCPRDSVQSGQDSDAVTAPTQ